MATIRRVYRRPLPQGVVAQMGEINAQRAALPYAFAASMAQAAATLTEIPGKIIDGQIALLQQQQENMLKTIEFKTKLFELQEMEANFATKVKQQNFTQMAYPALNELRVAVDSGNPADFFIASKRLRDLESSVPADALMSTEYQTMRSSIMQGASTIRSIGGRDMSLLQWQNEVLDTANPNRDFALNVLATANGSTDPKAITAAFSMLGMTEIDKARYAKMDREALALAMDYRTELTNINRQLANPMTDPQLADSLLQRRDRIQEKLTDVKTVGVSGMLAAGAEAREKENAARIASEKELALKQAVPGLFEQPLVGTKRTLGEKFVEANKQIGRSWMDMPVYRDWKHPDTEVPITTREVIASVKNRLGLGNKDEVFLDRLSIHEERFQQIAKEWDSSKDPNLVYKARDTWNQIHALGREKNQTIFQPAMFLPRMRNGSEFIRLLTGKSEMTLAAPPTAYSPESLLSALESGQIQPGQSVLINTGTEKGTVRIDDPAEFMNDLREKLGK